MTPFLAWAEGLPADTAAVHLFYCVRSKPHAAHLPELEAIQARVPGFHLHLIESSEAGRLTADRIAESIDVPIARAHVAFCGPEAMREDLRQALRSRGLPASRFQYEEFRIRSGIGIGAALAAARHCCARR